ncbi:hypothetical protein [Dolichospermum lemmermannii]|uniref:hypothetical protein n=1 Tax=Dolichospermum lemmermannii TaxID=54295 RepID=UPI00232E78DE|nr:hypothetical protein [Dolichospermum lemmermannii]
MFVVRCPLSVGAKHLEDKLSVIAKNSSPNASPVQLSVVRCPLFVVRCPLSVPFLSNTDNPCTNITQ